MADFSFPDKDPSDRLPVAIDFSAYLKAKPLPGDTLVSAEWSVTPDTLDVTGVAVANTGLCTAIVQNGLEGVTYTLGCEVLTSNGMVYHRSVDLTVTAR